MPKWHNEVMAKWYRPVARDQLFLLPPDMRAWLADDHPVWLVIAVVEEHLDTSAVHARRRTGGAGAAGYHPDMLVELLMWAYAHGVTSSRRIEALCGTDVAFRVICGGDAPDHSTVARFRQDFPAVIEELFAQVLMVCARLGMGQLGTVALDGTKIKANASKSANRAEETLRRMAAETVARHADTDAAEDDLFGAGRRGDRVPPGAAGRGRDRDERIRRALAELEAERAAEQAARDAAAQQHLDAAAAGAPRPGPPPAAAAVELARRAVQRARAAQQAKADAWQARDAAALAAAGRGLPGGRPVPPDQHCRVKQAQARLAAAERRAAQAERNAAAKTARAAAPVRNITDPDSRLMPVRGGGFIQGYNAQNVTSEDGLIIATRLTCDPTGTGWFEPMLRQAEAAARLITAHQPAARGASGHPGQGPGPPPTSPIKLFLADAGYLSEHNLTIDGPDRLIATGKRRDLEKAARSGASTGPPRGPATTAMAHRLTTHDAITAYRQRGHIAETPHGHIKHNIGFRQLSLRGKPKADAEWDFTCAVHNLFKALTTGHLTPASLASLPA